MNLRNNFLALAVFLLLFSSCKQGVKTEADSSGKNISLEYAKSFELRKGSGVKTLKVYGLDKVADDYETFLLVSREKLKEYNNEPNVIPVPCKRIICLSSTQLTYFFALDNIDDIVAINSSRHLTHEGMNERIDSGVVKKIGKEGHFNIELIASLNPDVIFISPFKRGGYDMLKSLGYPLVPMSAYEEETPLGRAEWVKMIAAFIDEEEKADSLFNGIKERYESLKDRTAKVEHRPSVFSGKLRSGAWYVPGGDSFYAHYFKDAGADYIIKDDKKAAYPLDFETMYAKAANADYWRLLLPEPVGYNKNALGSEDARYADFKAFQTGNIIACNIREKPFYEQNAMKPDVILADYIHFFHPELLPGYEPEFYEQLK